MSVTLMDPSAAPGHRRTLRANFAILTVWQDPAETVEHVTWARDSFAAMQPYVTGVYLNNFGTEG